MFRLSQRVKTLKSKKNKIILKKKLHSCISLRFNKFQKRQNDDLFDVVMQRPPNRPIFTGAAEDIKKVDDKIAPGPPDPFPPLWRSDPGRLAGPVIQKSTPVSFLASESAIKTLYLNRRKYQNALDTEFCIYLNDLLAKYNYSDFVAVILRSATNDLCPGADLISLYNNGLKGNFDEITNFLKAFSQLTFTLGTYRKAIFPCIIGNTAGAGTALVAHTPIRIATESGVFSTPGVTFGYFPDGGMTHFLPRLPGNLGMYLALTGKRIEASDLVRCEIANYYIYNSAINVLQLYLGNYSNPNLLGIVEALDHCQSPLDEDKIGEHLDAINRCFEGDSLLNIYQNLEREGTEWAANIINKLNTASPLSLHITFRLQKLGRNLELEDCLKLEYNLAQRLLRNTSSDFYAGVKSYLVENTGYIPRWKHSSIKDVTSNEVNDLFEPIDFKDHEALNLRRAGGKQQRYDIAGAIEQYRRDSPGFAIMENFSKHPAYPELLKRALVDTGILGRMMGEQYLPNLNPEFIRFFDRVLETSEDPWANEKLVEKEYINSLQPQERREYLKNKKMEIWEKERCRVLGLNFEKVMREKQTKDSEEDLLLELMLLPPEARDKIFNSGKITREEDDKRASIKQDRRERFERRLRSKRKMDTEPVWENVRLQNTDKKE
eukprot:TRINITY_DN4418_c0_g2_i1.p1 TRINITY_DN4418_c0_g2~~TRINITY_DN4418_c0_g2_i1.p1  ORF type:complete len:661 (+),score=98.83 TRINITY_DN4418_c0_g2_i1:138-2120(+)